MKILVGKVEITDGLNNQKTLKVFTDRTKGIVDFLLTGKNGTRFSISNMQCGWRGPNLPDNTYEYPTNTMLMAAVKEAIYGGVYDVVEVKTFVS